MTVNLPTNLLRSFVAIVDAGSMLGAAEQVYLTQSALSLQIKRLEDMVQQPLFVREGRRLVLTAQGELLLDYARRVLALHDEALAAVNSGQFEGPVRVGMVQDFAETLLGGVLSRFGELHPEAQLYARVAGTAELVGMVDRGMLDLAIGYAAADDADAISIAPTVWYGSADHAAREIVPLAVLDRPCRFREAATSALDAAGRPWRIAFETPNISTLRAAVEAGLGLTCRTRLLFPDGAPLESNELPSLPDVACVVRRQADLGRPAAKLAQLAAEVVRTI
jgi:DNA-binding transcriptional LysR family regulator